MSREIIQIIEGLETSDGAGVKLRRIIGGPDLNMLDPFLLFDEFGSDDILCCRSFFCHHAPRIRPLIRLDDVARSTIAASPSRLDIV